MTAVEAAIDSGADVNAVYETSNLFELQHSRETALFIAAMEGHLQIVQVLLNAGADPNIICSEGGTALTIAAARYRRYETIQLLLEAGADPILARPMGRSAVEWSSLKGDYPSFLLLLRATRDAGPPQDWSAQIIQTAGWRHDDLRHRILKVLTTEEPMAPLAQVARRGPIEHLRDELSRGADVNQRDAADNWTPLHWAAGYEGNVSRTQILLDSGADPNAKTKGGYTPLMAAVQVDCIDRVRLLLKAGADPNAVDEDARSALHIAAWRGSAEVIKMLLAAGADATLQNRWTQTPLNVAKARKRSLGEDVTSALGP